MPQRTTLTLEDDVAAGLREEARRSGRPLRAVVNEMLRVGLERGVSESPAPFRVQARDLGLRPGIELDDIAGLIERLEGSEHR